jgi:hypothetical protein
MYRVRMHVNISEGQSITEDNQANTVEKLELIIESAIGPALVEIFGEVMVDKVEVSLIHSLTSDDLIMADINVKVPDKALKTKNGEIRAIEAVELAIENTITATLSDIFASTQIDRVIISPEEIETIQITPALQSLNSTTKESLKSMSRSLINILRIITLYSLLVFADLLIIFLLNLVLITNNQSNLFLKNILEGFKIFSFAIITVSFLFQLILAFIDQTRFTLKTFPVSKKTGTQKEAEQKESTV